MDTIVTNAIVRGADYLKQHGRQVEKSLYAFFFDQGSAEAVIDALSAYQNEDGGFGHAYEPDLRCPDSSALCTTDALAAIWGVGISVEHPMIRSAVGYLIDTYDSQAQSWLMVPPAADSYPRAPWWQFSPDATTTKHNPRPQILGIFWRARDYMPTGLIEELAAVVLKDFMADLPGLEMHDLFNYLRLYHTPDLPQAIKEPLAQHLPDVIQRLVANDPTAWAGYNLRPYAVIESLEDEFYPLVATSLPESLLYLINEQEADGSWPLTWDWGKDGHSDWAIAEKDCRSLVALGAILTLQRLGAVVSS
jgi:hypothetical protein